MVFPHRGTCRRGRGAEGERFCRGAVTRIDPLSGIGRVLRCLVLLASHTASASSGQPERVVSLSLCTDQLVLVLADRRQIASLSSLSRDPDLSDLAASAASVPQNRGTVEEVLLQEPDLILAGPWGSYQAGKLLERLGRRVMWVRPAEDFDMIRAQVRQVGDALGQSQRAAAVLENMEQTLVALQTLSAASPNTAAIAYLAGGYTYGAGTLFDAVLQASGLENGAVGLGMNGFAPLPLESLVMLRPDYLFFQYYRRDAHTLGKSVLEHPALLGSRLGARRLTAALPRLACGTPQTAQVARELADGRAP